MEQTNNLNGQEALLYELRWKAFLVNFAFDVLGDGFYAVHPRNSKKGHLKPRRYFGILSGYSTNGCVSRETLSRWQSDMVSEDVAIAKKAIAKCITYLAECSARLYPSEGVWWDSSDDERQFFRESDGGLSDKYVCIDYFFHSINSMGSYAPTDEYGWPKACAFDKEEVERELPRLMGKYFYLSYGNDLFDGGEKEEWRIAASKGQEGYAELNLDLRHVDYDDGRYTLAARRVLAHWDAASGRSFFAWPIDSLKEKLSAVDGGAGLFDRIMKRLFGEKKDEVDDVKNIEDLMWPKELHLRKWKTFGKCFAYYARGLPGDAFPRTFGKDILDGEPPAGLSDEQLDEAFLAFLTFQSEMMVAFLLNNTLAVLRGHLSDETVEGVVAAWRERWAGGEMAAGRSSPAVM